MFLFHRANPIGGIAPFAVDYVISQRYWMGEVGRYMNPFSWQTYKSGFHEPVSLYFQCMFEFLR